MSPTRRCSWTKHKKMMEEEGYLNSDTNENYRSLVKKYQKKLGTLPSAKSHADMVASSKLQAIEKEVGRLNSTKLSLQEQARKTRKLIREANKDALFIEEIADAIRDVDFALNLKIR